MKYSDSSILSVVEDNRESKDWEWLDDVEYLVKIFLPLIFILIGLTGHYFGFPEEFREKLLFSGSLSAGLNAGGRGGKK